MGFLDVFGSGSTTTTTSDPSASTPIGLPVDPNSSLPPAGLESTASAISSAPNISSSQGIWGTITSDFSAGFTYIEDAASSAASAVEAVPGEIYGGAKSVVSTVYTDVKSGVTTVVSDVEKPIAGALSNIYMYVIGAVVILAGAIYFIGKGGAIGQAGTIGQVKG